MISGQPMEPGDYCEVKASPIAGQGLFATKDLVEGQHLFTETAFIVSSPRSHHDDAATTTTAVSKPSLPAVTVQHEDHHDTAKTAVSNICLTAIAVQHEHCPPCVRLAPTDTGGTLSGFYEETYRFALAYLSSTASIRTRVLKLSSIPSSIPCGTNTSCAKDDDDNDDGDDTDGDSRSHAMITLVRREVALLMESNHELRSLPSHELEAAVHRFWANCMGQEGSLYEWGSRFNHSCVANCTRVTLGDGDARRAFITLRAVAAGEELTLSYLPSGIEVMGTVVRRRQLWLSRGFLCRCDRCSQPRDEVRQVICPGCYKDDPLRRQQHSRSRSPEEPSVPACRDAGRWKGEEAQRRPTEVFADYWNQSRIWVCRSCGWCSNICSAESDGVPSVSLHLNEGVLSAEVFAMVMADTVALRAPSASSTRTAQGGRCAASKNRGRSRQGDKQLQVRRDAIKGMLERSVRLLGTRHWTTFSCAHMRLKLELSALLSHDRSGPPRSTASLPPSPRAQPGFLQWAIRELNALEQWLSAALRSATSHPPAYYIFAVVCDLLEAMTACSARDTSGGLQMLLDRVKTWALVFADKDQRRRFTAFVSAAGLL